MPRPLFIVLPLILVLSGVCWWSVGEFGAGKSDTDTEFEHRALNTLPYLNWAPVEASEDKSGVTKYVEGKTSDGLNFFNSTTQVKASLLDMHGKEVHTWTPSMGEDSPWQHAQVLPDGSLLVVAKDKYLAKVAWDSSVVWKTEGRFHHDISTGIDGKLYTIRRAEKVVSFDDKSNIPVVDDQLVILNSKGEEISYLSVYDIVKDKIQRPLIQRAFDRAKKKNLILASTVNSISGKSLAENSAFDVLHTNTVLPIERTVFEGCQKGDLLISVRNIDLIGCVDIIKKQLRWSWGQKNLSRQHHPTILSNGNILIFNNRPRAKLSQVLELNPKTLRAEWTTDEKTPKFFSVSRGSSLRLPNGNTLVSESDFGRAFEITKEQELVWEYYNPEVYAGKKGDKSKRGTFYRFVRLSPELESNVGKLLNKGK